MTHLTRVLLLATRHFCSPPEKSILDKARGNYDVCLALLGDCVLACLYPLCHNGRSAPWELAPEWTAGWARVVARLVVLEVDDCDDRSNVSEVMPGETYIEDSLSSPIALETRKRGAAKMKRILMRVDPGCSRCLVMEEGREGG